METLDQFYTEMPTESQIDSFIKSLEADIQHRNEGIQYRWQNYLNCIDDYSTGGICDKAAYEAISYSRFAIKELEYQKTISVREEEFTVNVLTDLEGNIVSDRIVNGRFGDCWIIPGERDEQGDLIQEVSFCSVAKKQDTYNKKGLKVMEKYYKVEFYYLTRQNKNGELITRQRILEEGIRDIQDVKFTSTHLNRIAYFAINN